MSLLINGNHTYNKKHINSFSKIQKIFPCGEIAYLKELWKINISKLEK